MRLHSNRYLLNTSWLVKLRSVAVVGQLVTVAAASLLLDVRLPVVAATLIVLTLTSLSNLFLAATFKRWETLADQHRLPWDRVLGLVSVMDMLSLTTLLFVTGGPNNPFSLFFFVNVSLCALMLNRNWAWAINSLTICCFAGLMMAHLPLIPLDIGLYPLGIRGDLWARFSLQHAGLFVAFATCSSVIVYFMTRLTDELREQQLRVRRAHAQQSRAEKLDALGTLAAGAAHELATPLSTIAIVACDVEQAFEDHPPLLSRCGRCDRGHSPDPQSTRTLPENHPSHGKPRG